MKYVNQPVRKTDAMSLVTGKPVYTCSRSASVS